MEVLLGWDVERRAPFAEAMRERPNPAVPPLPGALEWLGGRPGALTTPHPTGAVLCPGP